MSTLQIENQLLALAPLWDRSGATRVLAPTGRFSFGQSSACDVQVDRPNVQPVHCTIVCRNGMASITPVDGSDVFVNGTPVDGTLPIHSGDTVTLGSASFAAQFRPASSFQQTVPVPWLSGTSKSERKALDQRHTQLMQWQQRLDDRCVELDEQAAQIAARHTQLLERQREFKKRSTRFKNAQQEAFDLLQLQQDLAAKNSDRERSLNELDQQLAAARAELAKRESAVEVLEDIKREVESERSELEAGLRNLEDRQTEASERFRALKKIAEDVAAQEAELKGRIAAAEQATHDADASRRDAERSRTEFVAWQKEQEFQLKSAQEEFSARERQFQEMLKELSETQAGTDQLRAELTDREDRLAAELNSLAERESALQDAHKELNRQNCELKDLRSELEHREEQIRNSPESLKQKR